MTNKQEDPKKAIAIKIAKTKALAGGRPVTVNPAPSAGMPGSDKMAQLKEVTITASPISSKKPEGPVGLISVSQFGGGSKTYLKDEVIKMLNDAGMSKEATSIKSMRSVRGDMSDILNRLITKGKIKPVQSL